ncbi:hypothetical protein AMAG_17922 [Allomyces macrogynus ATCC 38327]|uniref:Uncharacterized protein n=1 Tax=Allomyces macrogynus (strain ATCC 38327) TaxID=578462 RepID=A0A0L0S1M0_ALLM3|nr:hypothetical protein AMAG_17922 [Allomyces macrogynus ATCC 38327]|eukprot:KNE56438.1 hypothetical protein AMAG_17922 [Allomyces macrogynus ATCC 38327]
MSMTMPGNSSRTASRTATPAGGASPMLSRPRGVRDTLSCECRRPRTPSPALLSPPQTPPRRHRSRSPLAPIAPRAPPSPSPSTCSSRSGGDDLQPVGCGSAVCQVVLSASSPPSSSSSASLGNLSCRAAAGPASNGRDSDVKHKLTLRSPQPVRAAARSDAPVSARTSMTRAAAGWGLGVPPRGDAGGTLPSLPFRNTTVTVAAAAEGGATATGADDDPKWRAMLPAPLFKDRNSSATSIPAIPPPLPPVVRRRPGTVGVRPRPLSYPAAAPSRSSHGTNPAAAASLTPSSSSSSSLLLLSPPPFLPAGASSRPSSRPPPSPSRHPPSPAMTRGPTRHSPAPPTAPLSPRPQPALKARNGRCRHGRDLRARARRPRARLR